MMLCAVCNDYPEGTACTMTGCPGRAFWFASIPNNPANFDDWHDAIRENIGWAEFVPVHDEGYTA